MQGCPKSSLQGLCGYFRQTCSSSQKQPRERKPFPHCAAHDRRRCAWVWRRRAPRSVRSPAEEDWKVLHSFCSTLEIKAARLIWAVSSPYRYFKVSLLVLLGGSAASTVPSEVREGRSVAARPGPARCAAGRDAHEPGVSNSVPPVPLNGLLPQVCSNAALSACEDLLSIRFPAPPEAP